MWAAPLNGLAAKGENVHLSLTNSVVRGRIRTEDFKSNLNLEKHNISAICLYQWVKWGLNCPMDTGYQHFHGRRYEDLLDFRPHPLTETLLD